MSDVTRHFGENIVLRGPADWATQVEQHLTGALMFRTGHAVIRSIWDRTPRTVRITPWTAAGANADANPQSWRDATPAGLRRRDLDGHDQTGAPGTGAGSGSHVRYTPGRFRADTVLRVPPHGVLLPGVQVNGGDEQTTVLLHELSHSLRHLYAAFHPELIPEARTTAVSSGGLPRAFDNSEELFAITVGNVYCSERNLSLRGGHVTQGPPGTPQSEVLRHLEFWREPTIYRLLTQAMGRMPAFTARIAAIDTRFNPFRAIRAGVGPFPRLRDWHGQPMDPYSSHGA